MSETASPIDQINALQKRILAGEEVTAEEMNTVITQLRSERSSISETLEKKRTKRAAGAKPVDIASLFKKKLEPAGPDVGDGPDGEP